MTSLPIALADLLAPAPARSSRGLVRADHLEQRHQRRRVEEVHADDVLGPRGRARQRGDRDRRSVRREHGVVTADHRKRPNRSRFSSARSGAASMTSVAGGELVEVRDGLEQLTRRPRSTRPFSTHLARPRRTALGAALERLGHGVVEQRPHPRRRAELRDAGAHRAGADHARGPSPAAELRLALLDERVHALDAVLGRHRQLVAGAAPGRGRRTGRSPRRRAPPACRAGPPAAGAPRPSPPARAPRRASRRAAPAASRSRARAPPPRRCGGRSAPAPSRAACPSRAPAAGCRRRPG